MEPALCACCGSRMRRQRDWLFRCERCRYQSSNLAAGPGTGIEGLEELRKANFETLLDNLEPLGGVRGRRLLEVGSAWGWFLQAAKRRGAVVHGIEPETTNADKSRDLGLPVECGLFPQDLRDRGPYDLVVFNDVLEHIPDPAAVMAAVEQLLSPGGLAVVNLPSSRGALYRIAGVLDALGMTGPFDRMWQKGFPSPHISYFAPDNLARMVESRTGLRQVSAFSLTSVTRSGLWPRIRSSHPGMTGALLYMGVWGLSFVLDRLPSDIQVALFQKPAG